MSKAHFAEPTSSSAVSETVIDEKAKSTDIDEHLLSFEELQERLGTSFDSIKPVNSVGLSEEVSKKRLIEYGPNILSPPKKTHPFIQYLKCLAQLFNFLLVVCAAFTWVLFGIDPVNNFASSYTGAILFGVALLNAFIEFYQHQKSAALLESFLNMIPSNCNVIRNGALKTGPAADLVPGDIIYVRMGDKIPADFYVIKAADFKVDNSSLTGESEPQERNIKNTHENPLEATNLAFNGEAYGVVIRTGDNTVLGQIANLTQGEAKAESPLSVEIGNFVKIISTCAISTAIIFFIVAVLKNPNPNASVRVSAALNFAIGVLVAWVPQGLPSTVSMLLTIAAKRMATKNVLVKDLQGVETLGAITLLATDKTGTLTRNQMTVTNLWVSGKLMVADEKAQQIPEGEIAFNASMSGVEEATNICCMCSRARFDRTDVPIAERSVTADATESGLFRFSASRLGTDIDSFPKVFEIPFNSDTKWHMSIHQKEHAAGPLTQFIKGAPERVLRICSFILIDGQKIELTDAYKAEFTKSYEAMAGKGHRVIGLAQNLLSGDKFPSDFVFDKEQKNFPTEGLCFVGLISLEDPPKHGVREAIGHCREAGVKVMMVTGDHPLTAEAIGRKINLMLSDTKTMVAKKTGRPLESIREHEYHAIVIHGETIDSLAEEDWDRIFSKDEIIFARTSPKHKLTIVKRAQALGHIVGVTGDGVNDSPALKKADLGIAMNISGSDVSKEAAAMVLLDDNFASTVNGIAEGRLIFINLKKSIQYVVTHIIPEVIPFLLNVVVPIPATLNALQILVIDLGFELLAALSYAWEPAESEKGNMSVPPRKPVTEESILRTKARAARLAARETDGKNSFTRLFSAEYWKSAFEKPEGEVLVDGNLLSWAYLEVGVIEFVGCLLTFFVVLWDSKTASGVQFRVSPYDATRLAASDLTVPFTTSAGNTLSAEDISDLIAQGQSSYYMGVMIIQMFNLFACKARSGIPFGLYPLKNLYTWGSVVAAVAFSLIIVYAAPFNIAFGTSKNLSPLYWCIPLATGFFVLFYATVRQLIRRKFLPQKMNPDIEGLQMYKTVFTN